MAGALRYLASQLEMPEQPDGSPQELQGDNDFEIEGFCRDNSGVITIVQKLRTPR